MQELVEDPVHGSIAQPFAARADQQDRRALRTGSVIEAQIGVEGCDGRRVQRQGTRLVELSVPDRHHAAARVEVALIEADCLADPHAGRRQQTDQGPEGRLGGGRRRRIARDHRDMFEPARSAFENAIPHLPEAGIVAPLEA